ncbi:MAG TPA: hypothetical protein VN231_05680 [Allosphingosinicella sp.]|nr:hypothetical protein [Allosphingosinicella sp.]
MMPQFIRGAVAILALASASGAFASPMPPQVPKARDGNIAIAEELEAARKADTLAAYDMFIARHPQHPLAQVARRERARLVRRGHR